MEKYFQRMYCIVLPMSLVLPSKNKCQSVTKRKVWVYVGGQQHYLCERMIFFMLSAMRKL